MDFGGGASVCFEMISYLSLNTTRFIVHVGYEHLPAFHTIFKLMSRCRSSGSERFSLSLQSPPVFQAIESDNLNIKKKAPFLLFQFYLYLIPLDFFANSYQKLIVLQPPVYRQSFHYVVVFFMGRKPSFLLKSVEILKNPKSVRG